MRIVHYTDKVRDALHSGYKPAGFLHCAVVEYATSRDDEPLIGYVIYVWDTREVVASGKARIKGATHGHAESVVGKTAKDSHELLKGSGDVVKDVNSVMAKTGTESSGAAASSEQVDKFARTIDRRLNELVKLLAADARDCGIVNDVQRDKTIHKVASNFFK